MLWRFLLYAAWNKGKSRGEKNFFRIFFYPCFHVETWFGQAKYVRCFHVETLLCHTSPQQIVLYPHWSTGLLKILSHVTIFT